MTAMGHFFFSLRQGIAHHPFLSLALLVGILVPFALWVRGQVRKGRSAWGTGGFLQLPLTNGKEGLNGFMGNGGGTQQGKVD